MNILSLSTPFFLLSLTPTSISLYISLCLWLSLSHHCLSFYLSMFHSLTQSFFISFLSLPSLPLVNSFSLWDCLSLSHPCVPFYLSFSLPPFFSFYLSSLSHHCLSFYLSRCGALFNTNISFSTFLSLQPCLSFYPFYLSPYIFSLSFFLSLWLSLVHPWPVLIFLCFSLPLSLDIFSLSPTPVFLFETYLCL